MEWRKEPESVFRPEPPQQEQDGVNHDTRHHLADTVIVGAGLSGLTAAYRLTQAQQAMASPATNTLQPPRILLLEASDRVGGRLLTHTLSDTQYLDVGGAWVGNCQPNIMGLLRELGIDTFHHNDEGAVIIEDGGKVWQFGNVDATQVAGIATECTPPSANGPKETLVEESTLHHEQPGALQGSMGAAASPSQIVELSAIDSKLNSNIPKVTVNSTLVAAAASDSMQHPHASAKNANETPSPGNDSSHPAKAPSVWFWIAKLGLVTCIELFLFSRRFQADMQAIDAHLPHLHPKAAYYDRMSAEKFISNYFMTARAKRMVNAIIREVLCVEPCRISYWGLLWNSKTAGTVQQMLEVKDGAQELRIAGGAQGVCHALVERLRTYAPAVQGWFRSVVTSVDYDVMRDNYPVRIQLRGGVTIRCRRIILAMPPTAYRRIHFLPALPAFHQGLINAMVMGSVSKISLVYDEPFWRAMGLSGNFHLFRDDAYSFSVFRDASSYPCPIGAVTDGSTPGGTHVLKVFVTAAENVTFCSLSADLQREIIMTHIIRLFGERAAKPRHFVVASWNEDNFALGGYGNIVPAGWLSCVSGSGETVPDVLKGVQWGGRLFFAGTESSVDWNGYMDGAVSSGERAAAEVLASEEQDAQQSRGI